MNKAQLRHDVDFLAGTLIHRGASTHSERAAAEFIRDRLAIWSPQTEIDDFHTHGATSLLFACYFAEFLIVSLVAQFWPWPAFGYGLTVMVMYLIEFGGFSLLARFLPQFDTQNVIARFFSPAARHLFVVTAHYDSPKENLLASARLGRWLRPLQILVACAMAAILLSCAAQALGIFNGYTIRPDYLVRWVAAVSLAVFGYYLIHTEVNSDFARGADDNASGVATLLGLAQAIHQRPFDNADVWLVATGSNGAWMSGMRHLLAKQAFDRRDTYFVDIDQVGRGNVRYLTSQGLFLGIPSSKTMLRAAKAVAGDAVKPARGPAIPTDAYLALSRDYHAIGVTAEPKRRVSDDEYGDRPAGVDIETVNQAGDFVEALLRELEAKLTQEDR